VWQKHKKEQFFPNIFFFRFFLYEYQYWTEKEEKNNKEQEERHFTKVWPFLEPCSDYHLMSPIFQKLLFFLQIHEIA
jgi:hypothetical protein